MRARNVALCLPDDSLRRIYNSTVIGAVYLPTVAARGNWSGAFRRERFYTAAAAATVEAEVEHLDFSIFTAEPLAYHT